MIGERICFAMTYLAEAMMAWLYFGRLFLERRDRRTVIFSILTVHILLFLLSLLDSLAINASAFFLFNILLMLGCYSCSMKRALFHGAFMSFVMIGSEIIVALLLNFVGNEYNNTYNFTVLLTLAVCSKLLYFLIIMLCTRIIIRQGEEYPDPNFMLLLCALPLASMFVAATIVFVGMYCVFSGWLEILMAFSVITLLAVNILVLIIYERVKHINKENSILQMSAVKDAANLEYYSMLSEQYANQRILIHDFNSHINTVNALFEEGDLEAAGSFLRSLSSIPTLKLKLNYSNDPILNILLLQFSEKCREKNINFQCSIRSENFSFMEASDISAVFSNLLSNACEAAETSCEKYIELSVSLGDVGNNLIISLENSCDEAPSVDVNGNYISRKNDKGKHGLGLKSIERVVRKYEGMIKYRYSPEKKFYIIINIPLSNA